VKFSFEGNKFEILVRPDPALEYKLGKRKDLYGVMVSDEIYTDSSRGTRASSDSLLKAFRTEDPADVARQILQKGDLNLTTDQRRKMTEAKRRQIVERISKTFVDPRSHLPHPPLRIEHAMKDARVSVDPQKGVAEQVKDVVERLRGVIPLKSENMDLEIVVPAQYAARSYSIIRSTGTVKSENWLSNGSLKAVLEISAAERLNVIERLGSATKGTATVEMVR
jgi:ribosome maturation protein SDO1